MPCVGWGGAATFVGGLEHAAAVLLFAPRPGYLSSPTTAVGRTPPTVERGPTDYLRAARSVGSDPPTA